MAMSPSRRMILWGLAISAGHVALGLIARLALDVPGSLLFFGLCAGLSLAVALLGARLVRPDRPPEGGPGPPPADEPELPPWWPEFERDFRAYASRPRTRA
jgi:hypothetical protein